MGTASRSRGGGPPDHRTPGTPGSSHRPGSRQGPGSRRGSVTHLNQEEGKLFDWSAYFPYFTSVLGMFQFFRIFPSSSCNFFVALFSSIFKLNGFPKKLVFVSLASSPEIPITVIYHSLRMCNLRKIVPHNPPLKSFLYHLSNHWTSLPLSWH